MTNPDEIMEAGTRLADGLVAIYQLRGPASTIRQLVLALGRERQRANALERIVNDPESIPCQIGRLTDAALSLVDEAKALREAIPDEGRESRLAAALQSIASPSRIGVGCMDARTWADLAQSTARRALQPRYVADGSWSWSDTGPIFPGEPGTPTPGSMAAMVAETSPTPEPSERSKANPERPAGDCICGHGAEAHWCAGDACARIGCDCKAFVLATPDPDPERAPMVETRYGTLPVGTRFAMPNPRSNGGGWFDWSLTAVAWEYHDAISVMHRPHSQRFSMGEIPPPLTHDEVGWPIYPGDRVRTSLGPEGMAWGHPTRLLGVHVAGKDGTPDWVIAVSDGTTLRKIHDEPAA